MKKLWIAATLGAALALAGCDQKNSVEEFYKYVSKNIIGDSEDYWIQLYNVQNEWENVALVFGYAGKEGTKIECEIMIAALKEINYLRKYRCEIAN